MLFVVSFFTCRSETRKKAAGMDKSCTSLLLNIQISNRGDNR